VGVVAKISLVKLLVRMKIASLDRSTGPCARGNSVASLRSAARHHFELDDGCGVGRSYGRDLGYNSDFAEVSGAKDARSDDGKYTGVGGERTVKMMDDPAGMNSASSGPVSIGCPLRVMVRTPSVP
jgi:hypothetical protein